VRPLIVDALAFGRGKRQATRDVIGAGPRSIAGVLESSGIEPRIAPVEEALGRAFNPSAYDLLMVSGMTSDLRTIRRMVARWRKSSEGPALIGGPVASDAKVLRKVDADIAVTGEGEFTLLELLNLGLNEGTVPEEDDLSSVKGIIYKTDLGTRVNPLRPRISRMEYEGLTPSTRTISSYPLFRAARVYVEALRGCSNYHRAQGALPEEVCEACDLCRSGGLEARYDCPHGVPPGCGYCSVPSLFGPPKSRSVDKIHEEVESLLREGVRRVVLSAPGFLDYGRDLLVEPKPLTDPRNPEPNYDSLERLLSKLSGLAPIADGEASLMIENLKGDLVTERAADILSQYLSGTPVNIGFETGSDIHCRRIGRSSTPKENLNAVRRLRKVGLKPYVYFVHGLPGQNEETVKATVRAIDDSVAAGAYRIILYRFQPLPMSAFQDLPRAPPSARNPLSGLVHDAAAKANSNLKEKLVGSRMRVVVAEPYSRDHRYHVAYPMLHGPVVLVEQALGLEGKVVDVDISGVASDRIVIGTLMRTNSTSLKVK
jgi:radical SAM superfamily enzyme YgiQ (UPF0313 family)